MNKYNRIWKFQAGLLCLDRHTCYTWMCASSEHPYNDVSCLPYNNSPVPKMVAVSSFFCVSGTCDFVVSTFFVMKSKWYPICLGENVQTTAKLYVVKKKICNLFAVNTALNDRVQRKSTSVYCMGAVIRVELEYIDVIYIYTHKYHEKLSWKY